MAAPKAVLFDMDGLMFDTERLGVDAWAYIAEKMGIAVTQELSLKALGISWEANKILFFHEIGEFDFDYAKTLFLEYVHRHIEANGIPIKDGLYELLSFLDDFHLKKAVVSSSLHDGVIFYLEKAGIRDSFDEIVTGEMVARSKPNPDIYLHAAKLLNIAPEECMVLEDSINGIKAGYAAKMIPIMIPDLIQPTLEIKPFLFAALNSLTEVIELIKNA